MNFTKLFPPPTFYLAFFIAVWVTQFQNNLTDNCNATQNIFYKKYAFSRWKMLLYNFVFKIKGGNLLKILIKEYVRGILKPEIKPFMMSNPKKTWNDHFMKKIKQNQKIYMYSLRPKHTIPSPLKEPITSSHKIQPLHSVFRENSSYSINKNISIQTKAS